MQHRPRWRASTLIAGAGALLAALVLLGTGVGLARDREERLDDAAERQAVLARVLEDHASRSLDSTAIALASLADTVARGAPAPVLQAQLVQTQAALPFLRGVAMLDATGRVAAAATPADRGARLDPLALGPWPVDERVVIGSFVSSRSLAGLAPDNAEPPAPVGVGFIPVLRALALADGRRALLVAMINPDALANFQQVTLNDDRSGSALLSLDGQVLASTAFAVRRAGDRVARLTVAGAPLARVRDGEERGRWQGPSLRSDAQLVAFRALRERPFVVLVETPQDLLHSQWMGDVKRAGLLAGGTAIALLVLSGIGAAAQRARERSQLELDRTQQRVAARERELSAIFGSVQDLLLRTDATGHVTFINERYAQLSGQATQRALGRPLHELFGGATAVDALFEPPPAPGDDTPRRTRADWIAADAQARSFEITLVPLRPDGGELQWVGSATDVSSLVRTQAELRAQLGLARSLLASSPLPISVLDRGNRYLDVNRAWEQFTGRKRDDVLGRRAASYLPPEEAAVHDARDAELLARGGETSYETPWRGPDGQRRELFLRKATFADADGRPLGIVVCLMDISDFREAERATRAARDAALQASSAKSEFIANVSHELRTPLQSILGFSELGQRRARDLPQLVEMFADVHRAGQRMLSLVNDLLDLSKIENIGEPVRPERVDLRAAVDDVAQELAPLLAARTLVLAAPVGGAQGDAPLWVRADPLRLHQVLRNVLANAIKFSPEGSSIELTAGPDADGVRLDVADRGPGIPPGELDSVFEAFVQSSATKDGAGGTGLGLAICRRIVAAHGGRIWAANRDGGGAVISLVLPAAAGADTLPAGQA